MFLFEFKHRCIIHPIPNQPKPIRYRNPKLTSNNNLIILRAANKDHILNLFDKHAILKFQSFILCDKCI